MSAVRLLWYVFFASWLGSVQNSWFRAMLDSETTAFVTTSVISVALIGVLVLMGWQDCHRGWVHS